MVRPPALAPLPDNHARVLGVRLCNWVGEVVLMMPALRRLEAAGYEPVLVGRGWASALLEGTGWRVVRRPGRLGEAIGTWRRLRQEVAPEGRPPALLFTKSLSSALETRLSGWRPIGYARDGRGILLDRSYPLPSFEHASHAYWHLVSQALGSTAPYPTQTFLAPSSRQRDAARQLLAAQGLEDKDFVVICPSSGADDREGRKVWPHFSGLGERLAERGIPIVVCPGPGEADAARRVLPSAIVCEHVDLGVYAAILERARAVVANDTGPGHLAAAVGARLVAIYGPQSVAAWAPLGRQVDLHLCAQGWPDLERIHAALERAWAAPEASPSR